MATEIAQLQAADVDAVDALMKQNSGTVGFLPRIVLEKHVQDASMLGARTEDGELAGYLLYAAYSDRFRIVQLCVAEGFRGQGIAKRLIEALKAAVTTQKVIRLNCRNDFPAHRMWPKLGFVPVSEKPGRSREGHLLTRWRLLVASDGDQLALFRANISEDILDVVIDAQIFFDFSEPDNESTLPSKALLSDLFVDSLNIWTTDELLTEINRNTNASERNNARIRASQFPNIRHDPISAENLVAPLREILPSGTESQVSDINHLAKTGASDVRFFVTRDQPLLRKATQLREVTGLEVLSPAELILRLRELSDTQTATPDHVAGLRLVWRRLTAEELSGFPFTVFLQQNEKVNQLRSRVELALADPANELEVLWSGREPVALRVLNRRAPDTLTLSLGRAASSGQPSLFARFIVADVIYRAIQENLVMVRLESSALPDALIQGLSEMGFTQCGDGYVRFCLVQCSNTEEALAKISLLSPESLGAYQKMDALDIEGHCSPMLSEADQNYYMIPIRPGFALNLFDRQQSGRDLFGGNQAVLLRWDNVYYRSAHSAGIFQPPARILWYASSPIKQIVAVSRLDEVVVNTPKELFRKFKRYGTLEWSHLYDMSKHDIARNLMALRFSHSFPLTRRILWNDVRTILVSEGVQGSIQGPRKIPQSTFSKLFQFGFPEE